MERESSDWWELRKAEGNAAFKAGQHQTAIKHYTAALMRLQAGDPNPVRAVSRTPHAHPHDPVPFRPLLLQHGCWHCSRIGWAQPFFRALHTSRVSHSHCGLEGFVATGRDSRRRRRCTATCRLPNWPQTTPLVRSCTQTAHADCGPTGASLAASLVGVSAPPTSVGCS